ncbi:MAG: ATPase, T2SS/T4P/T4SS family [Rhodoferax sp.]|uniref:GspE/PulE family protein n=1 Tax=Rhodoferax sp. TaxID=50421 RepID=UPI0026271F65|nr:type II/IV secretion system protein [Rhodoferax sp.]MDD2881336.1 ATPase, T2SS/T4P/T4SS family [Rhodoferax sp.]
MLEQKMPPSMAGLDGFCWPAPLSVLYSKAEPWTEPQACELEGLNGAVRRCALVSISPAVEAIQILVERAAAPITMAFSQFQRLTLKKPIYPQDLLSAEHFPDIQSRQATAEYHLHLADGSVRSGLTVGYGETSFGLFVFTPMDNRGTVERVFIPRSAYASVSMSNLAGPQTTDTPAGGATANVMAHNSPAVTNTLMLEDYLADAAVVSREQLMLALDHQSKMPAVRVGEALLRLGFVSEEQLQQALAEQSGRSAKPLGELLIQAGALTRRDLNTALARKMGYPVVDVTRFPIEAAALEKISLTTARRLMALPLLTRGELTVVASPNPTRREFLEELEFLLRGRVIATLGDEDQILQTMTTAYDRLSQGNWPPNSTATQDATIGTSSDGVDLLERMDLHDFGALPPSPTSPVNEFAADTGARWHNSQRNTPPLAESDPALDQLVTTMILQAHSSDATGIHIEVPPDGTQLRIRFRQNGRLVPYATLPHQQHTALVAHIKTMAHLDVFEQRRPQVGKIDFDSFSPLHQVRLRVSTLPTANGLQDVVLKLLPRRTPLALEQLDLSPQTLEGLQHATSQPRGLLLCTGPVDSGKTTTLHAVLAALYSPERNIWCAQTDPVASLDSSQTGVRQVQINPHIGWTYAAALRSFLQADADILMADELPDTETAQVAVEAALTGHLMLSTLPANSAVAAVQRLLNLGVNPFSLADALQAVLAQRLVSRFCQSCRSSEPTSQADIDGLLDDYLRAFPEALRPARHDLLAQWIAQYGIQGALHTYHATGCSHCQGSGMAGRIGVQELLCMTPGLRRLIQTGAKADALLAEAFKDSKFCTLRQDGLAKVLAGLTSLDDIRAHTHD